MDMSILRERGSVNYRNYCKGRFRGKLTTSRYMSFLDEVYHMNTLLGFARVNCSILFGCAGRATLREKRVQKNEEQLQRRSFCVTINSVKSME